MGQKIHRPGLAGRVARLLSFGLVIFVGSQAADAKQCSVAMPSTPHGHWSYRIIDGRKCWYQGENNFPKSLLQWPERAPALSAFGRAEPSRDEEPLPPSQPRNQSGSDQCCKTPLGDSESFEARWRALEVMR
jgi:hypothetical protein